jgi:predicted phosphate transport protein (TIGR00153 family)
MKLMPRDEKFFSLFLSQVELICEAARLLLDGVKAGPSRLALVATEIRSLEHQGDEVIHEIFTKLNQTFITPLDPEDIHSLSTALDDVLDGIEDAAHRMVAYRLDPITGTVVELAEVIYSCSRVLQKAMEALDSKKPVLEHCIEINRLENEADILVRSAVASLFDNEKDAIQLIKLKEIYELLEDTTDHCEDVADVLQNVVVKNS